MDSPVKLCPQLNKLIIDTPFEKLLNQLLNESNKLYSFAPKFDYNENIKYNGIRTFLKIVQEYFYEVHAFLIVSNSNKQNSLQSIVTNSNGNNDSSLNSNNDINKNEQEKMKDSIKKFPSLDIHLKRLSSVPKKRWETLQSNLLGIGEFFMKHCSWIHLHIQVKHGEGEMIEYEDGVKVNSKEKFILDSLMKIDFETMGHFYNDDLTYFWLPEWRRNILKKVQTFRIFSTHSLMQSFTSLMDANHKRNLLFNHYFNASFAQMKAAFAFFVSKPFGWFMWINSFFGPNYSNYYEFDRQKKYGLNSNGELDVTKAPYLANQSEKVNCLYICHGNDKFSMGDQFNYSLVLHFHGSGYTILNPDFHRAYLTEWSGKLNVPILVPDYSKAPSRPFPHAIQDLFDLYLYLTDETNKSSIEEKLGFYPENIILSGDSAGGNLALVLAILINELNRNLRSKKQKTIPLPKAIGLMYPNLTPIFATSPSKLLLTIDPMLGLSTVFTLSAAYLAPFALDNENDPWYRRPKEIFEQILHSIIKFKNHPLTSPMTYEHLDDLKNIPCYISSAEYDILLDDGIEIAKKWKGPVELDIVPNMPHAYVMFNSNPTTQKHVQRYLDFISKQLM